MTSDTLLFPPFRTESLQSTATRPPRITLGKVPLDGFDEQGLIADLLRHASTGITTRQIATVNAQFYVLAEKSLIFRQCLEEAEYLCADGMSIVWACRALLGKSLPRIAGVDLVGKLCAAGAAQGLRVFLLGGRPGTAAESARILQSKHPGLVIAGTLCPSFGFEENEDELEAVLTMVREARPHVIFLALGAPKQELFIAEHIRPLRVPVAVGVGGSFEMISGVVDRAPSWMQASGLEWCHRISQEPNRLLKRYLVGNTEFLMYLLRWRISREFRRASSLGNSTMLQTVQPKQTMQRAQ